LLAALTSSEPGCARPLVDVVRGCSPRTRVRGISHAIGGVRRPSRWPWVEIAVTGFVALTSLCCGAGGRREEYVSVPARRGDLTVTVAAKGSLEALDQVNVVANVGSNVVDVYVHQNDSVEAGQPLCQLDPEHWQLMVSRAEAQQAADQTALQRAQEGVKAAELALRRAEQQAPKSPRAAASLEGLRTALEKAHADEQLATSQITVSTAALDAARTALDHTLIRAPMSGVVVSRAVEPGQVIVAETSAPTLFVLARDLRRMELRVFVDENDAPQLALGQSATFAVTAFPDRPFPARLSSIRNVALRQGHRVGFEARLEVDNSAALLRPGMLADVSITTAERKAVILVPSAALRFAPEFILTEEAGAHLPAVAGEAAPEPAPGSEAARTLWTVDEHGKPRAKHVTVGSTDGSWSEVVGDAVQPDEHVAVDSLVRSH
jgi:HlyD family secretion protein